MNKVTTTKLLEMKSKGEKITALTAYDFQTARLLDEAGIDIILVGDSLGMVILGYENTLGVTVEDVLYHTKAVTRGVKRAMVIADMPFMSYQTGVRDTLLNAARFMKEGNAHGVKLEGGERVLPQIKALTEAGIPVMGHLGLTPQSVYQLGGFKVQGRDKTQAEVLITEAKKLEDAGIFSLVLECIPVVLAKEISQALTVPTIGIGAGPDCDGQILVTQDMLGLDANFKPKFVRRYANLHETIKKSVEEYIQDVKRKDFPGLDESFHGKNSLNDGNTQLYSGGDAKNATYKKG